MAAHVSNPTVKKAKGYPLPRRGHVKARIFEEIYKLLTTLSLLAGEIVRGGGRDGGEGGSAAATPPHIPPPDGWKIGVGIS